MSLAAIYFLLPVIFVSPECSLSTASSQPIPALLIGFGTHTVKYSVTDNTGNTAENSFSFKVEWSFTSLRDLIEQLMKNGQFKNKGIQTSIEAKLNQVESQLQKGNDDQAVKHLNDLLKAVQGAKESGGLNAEGADQLISLINDLLGKN